MSRRKKNKNKYKNKTYSKPVAYSYSNSKDIKPLAFQVFGSLYYTSEKQS